ncbi:flocculation protein FLO11-like isoform X2 [Hermetia illucens]|uniref:flocculation protein FLO11-like isoform X2 n=1 Tax=Hermetia illucens TaxID=343691 RepID=UPI0018CC0C11|nr:flocculation protein FLO11-like isoform X2 [Hermetia illucens]XP_037925669.1 flocculation protein FLO11-like isoform X2 [Hermetia illucens]
MLLLIFMFVICSGGSWWYKFCRQSENASHYPSIPLTIEPSARPNFSDSRTHRTTARAFDRTSATEPSSYYFHRIWKANNVTTSPNCYTSIVQYHNAELDGRRQHYGCPYYQLYEPPPSYESVVQVSDSGNNRKTSCVLVPATTATTPQMSACVSSVPTTSAAPPPLLSPPKSSRGTSSQPQVVSTNRHHLHELCPATSTTTSESFGVPLPQHLLHDNNQNSMPSTSNISQYSCNRNQQQHLFHHSLHHHKMHYQSHHLLYHPTIHSLDVNTTVTIGKSSTPSNRAHGGSSYQLISSNIPFPTTPATTTQPSSSPAPTAQSSSSPAPTAQSSSVPITALPPSGPIDENDTRV